MYMHATGLSTATPNMSHPESPQTTKSRPRFQIARVDNISERTSPCPLDTFRNTTISFGNKIVYHSNVLRILFENDYVFLLITIRKSRILKQIGIVKIIYFLKTFVNKIFKNIFFKITMKRFIFPTKTKWQNILKIFLFSKKKSVN